MNRNNDLLPYDRNPELNAIVNELMNDWHCLVEKAKNYGMDICYAPGSATLELYFHNDYPDMILVDKFFSCLPKGETDAF